MNNTVYRNGLRTGLVVAGVLLAWSLGCQTEGPHSSPGALPGGPAMAPNPNLNASTYYTFAHLLERQGNFPQAAQKYRQALDLNPGFTSARNRLGISLNKLGQHAEASAQFRQAIRDNPTNANLHNNLGFSLYLEGHSAEAIQTLRRAVEIKPDFRRAHMNLGVVLARLGRYDEALDELRLATDEATAYYNLAVVQTEARQFAAAARSLEAALQHGPDFPAAREQLRLVARLAAEAESPKITDVDVAEADTRTEPEQPVPVTQQPALPEEPDVAADVSGTEEPQPAALATTEEPSPETAPVASPAAPAQPEWDIPPVLDRLAVARAVRAWAASFVGPPAPGTETPTVNVGPAIPDAESPFVKPDPLPSELDTPFGTPDVPFGDVGWFMGDFPPADVGIMLDDLVEAGIHNFQAAYDWLMHRLEQRLAAMETTS